MTEILGGDNSPGGKRFRFSNQNMRMEDIELETISYSSPNNVYLYIHKIFNV
jgi:hypothetical protein